MNILTRLLARAGIATTQQLQQTTQTIMAGIKEFSVAMKAFQDKQDVAITDLQGDIQTLNDKITALQNSTGTVTPEDQALLDEIQTRASAVSAKLDALDNLTPPAAPVV